MDTRPQAHPTMALEPGLARDLAERLGLTGIGTRDGLVELLAAMARSLPHGTLAKHGSVAAGELPPGADADDCARRVLVHLDGSRPSPEAPSWTCWVLTTLAKGLVDAMWGWPARVIVTRNLDGRVPVDFHSVIEVDAPDATVVLDPLFGMGPVPIDGTFARGPWRAQVTLEADGRRAYRWSTPGGTDARYRSVSGPVDADDITAFLHVSTVHTGMSARRWWRIIGDTTCASLTDDAEHGPLLKRYTHDGDRWACDEAFIVSWTDATAQAIDHVWGETT